MVFDDNSSLEQKEKLKNLCKRYENITWINPYVCEDSKAPNLTCVKTCDEYLKKNNIDKKWILFFENDVFPFQEDFWQKLNTKIKCLLQEFAFGSDPTLQSLSVA